MKINHIYQGDTLEVLKTFPDESINCVITSPPYWALRDYGVKGQLGLESTFQEYITKLCDIFDEVKRVLRKDGTCWVNLGDTYFNNSSYSEKGRQGYGNDKIGMIYKKGGLQTKTLCQIPTRFSIKMTEAKYKCTANHCRYIGRESDWNYWVTGVKLCPKCRNKYSKGSPEKVDDGWILRNTIIWHKPNCMPSSVKDRFTVDYEYVFFFVKNKKYWFEQQKEKTLTKDNLTRDRDTTRLNKVPGRTKMAGLKTNAYDFKNKRCVWKIPTKPFSDAHFAVFPEELVETPIKAGCPEFVCNKCGKGREKIYKDTDTRHWTERQKSTKKGMELYRTGQRGDLSGSFETKQSKYIGYSNCSCNAGFSGGIVLDPFIGSGTVAVMAQKLQRNWVGIDLNPEYIKIANKRIKQNNFLWNQ